MKWMQTDEKLNHLLKDSKEAALNYAEEKMQVRSKKKRIRKKIRKQILTELSIMEEAIEQEEVVEEAPHESSIEADVGSLPVTFVLELGRKYFGDLDVVKSYYTKTKEEYYKNRELLTETMNQAIQRVEPSIQREIIAKIEEKQK